VLASEGEEYGLHALIYGDTRLLWRTEQLLLRNDEIAFPNAYREWIEDVYADDPWDDEPDRIIGEHMAWRDDCRSAAMRARQLR
jgi:CRISPR-associated endonuclease/helicase Cas3